MEITKLQYFLTLVSCGSFSKAAEKLYISQSALSKSIKGLESALNVTLVNRSYNGVTLTDAGRLFLPYAELAVAQYTTMKYEISSFSDSSKNLIKVGTLPLADEYGISNAITDYWVTHPELQISFVERNQQELLTKLDNGTLSLAILRTDFIDKEKYTYTNIISDKFAIACSNKNPLSKKQSVSLSSLKDERFILLEKDSDITRMFYHACKQAGFIPLVPFNQTRHKPLLNAVSKNLGITALPFRLIETASMTNISIIPMKEDIITNVGIVTLNASCSSTSCHNLKDYIIKRSLIDHDTHRD